MSAALEVQPRDLEEYRRAAEMVETATRNSREVTEVVDSATEETAMEALARVKAAVKAAQSLKLEATKPLRDSTESINTEFKELVAPLDGVVKGLEAQILTHRKREEEKAKQAQREEQERIDAERKRLEENARKRQEEEDAKAAAEQREAVEQKPLEIPDAAPPPAPTKTKATASGTQATTVDNWKHEVVDIDAVPEQFTKRVLQDAVVKAWIKEQRKASPDRDPEIPGLRIYNDAHVAVSS